MPAEATPWTFFLLKPDALRRGLGGAIIERIEALDFRVVSQETLCLDAGAARAFYDPYTFSPLPSARRDMIKGHVTRYLTESDCLCLRIERPGHDEADLFSATNYLKGKHYVPERCAPGSIRHDFRDRFMFSTVYLCGVQKMIIPAIDGVVYNLVHCPKHVAERDHQMDVLISCGSKAGSKIGVSSSSRSE